MASSASSIKLEIKTQSDSKLIEISKNASIIQVKEAVSSLYSAPADKLCLICQGKIMKDTELLTNYSLSDNSVIHLVIKGQTRTKPTVQSKVASKPEVRQEEEKKAEAKPNQNKFEFNQENLSMASQFLNMTPDSLVESMLLSNPQVQKMIQENPELRSHLTGANLKKMAEMMSNPTMKQELLRNQENMIHQIQNFPGGASQLERLMNSMPEMSTPSHYEFNGTENENEATHVRPNLSGEPIPDVNNHSSNSNTTQNQNPNNMFNTDMFGFGGGDQANFFNQLLSHGMNNSEQQQSPQNGDNTKLFDAMSKPAVIQAIMEINKNLDILKKEAPGLFPNLSDMMNQNFGSTPNQPLNPSILQRPKPTKEELRSKYTQQLNSLKEMGFHDEDRNIEALEACFGNIDRAIDWLFNSNK